MAIYFLCDFGASRIKTLLWHSEQGLLGSAERAAPQANHGLDGAVTLKPADYIDAWQALAAELFAIAKPDQVWLCSEMHGALIADEQGRALTPYCSWRDARGVAQLAVLQSALGDDYLARSGMRLKPGLPVLTFAALAAQQALPAGRMMSLAEWLLCGCGEPAPQVHVSLAAASGCYDLAGQNWAADWLSKAGLSDLQFSTVQQEIGCIGTVQLAGLDLPVYGGFGDMQAACAGALAGQQASWVLNLGTGSQVVAVGQPERADCERRPAIAVPVYQVITHIPSGRALNLFASWFDQIAALCGGQGGAFWPAFAALTAPQVLSAKVVVDLRIFEAAWGYQQGGSLSGLHEGCSVHDLLAGIALGWLRQYSAAMQAMGDGPGAVIVSGGLPQRLPWVLPVLQALLGRAVRLAVSRTGEETLDGLLWAAERFAQSDLPKS